MIKLKERLKSLMYPTKTVARGMFNSDSQYREWIENQDLLHISLKQENPLERAFFETREISGTGALDYVDGKLVAQGLKKVEELPYGAVLNEQNGNKRLWLYWGEMPSPQNQVSITFVPSKTEDKK